MVANSLKFGDITILDLNAIHAMMGEMIENSIRENVITLQEVKAYLKTGKPRTFENFIRAGTPAVEAAIAVSNKDVTVTEGEEEESRIEFARRSTEFAFLCVLMTGSVPLPTATMIPAFLVTGLGLEVTKIGSYRDSFTKITAVYSDCSWVMSVDLKKLGPKAKNRMSLGMPGMRSVSAVACTKPKADASPEALACREWIIANLDGVMAWDLHPATRSADVISQLGSLNANVGQLMLELYTRQQLDMMVTTKMIFKIPVENSKHQKWRRYANLTNFKASMSGSLMKFD